jgi:hypothetical protein
MTTPIGHEEDPTKPTGRNPSPPGLGTPEDDWLLSFVQGLTPNARLVTDGLPHEIELVALPDNTWEIRLAGRGSPGDEPPLPGEEGSITPEILDAVHEKKWRPGDPIIQPEEQDNTGVPSLRIFDQDDGLPKKPAGRHLLPPAVKEWMGSEATPEEIAAILEALAAVRQADGALGFALVGELGPDDDSFRVPSYNETFDETFLISDPPDKPAGRHLLPGDDASWIGAGAAPEDIAAALAGNAKAKERPTLDGHLLDGHPDIPTDPIGFAFDWLRMLEAEVDRHRSPPRNPIAFMGTIAITGTHVPTEVTPPEGPDDGPDGTA